MMIVLDLWPRIASFCTYHDILNRLFLLNMKMTRKLRSANIELWLPVATSLLEKYMAVKAHWTRENVDCFLSNYYRHNLHFKINWMKECEILYQYEIASQYMCWYEDSNVFYIFQQMTPHSDIMDATSVGDVKCPKRRWYELTKNPETNTFFTVTASNRPHPNHLHNLNAQPVSILRANDHQEMRKALLGFRLEVRQWFVEVVKPTGDIDPRCCRQCGRIVAPCSVLDKEAICC